MSMMWSSFLDHNCHGMPVLEWPMLEAPALIVQKNTLRNGASALRDVHNSGGLAEPSYRFLCGEWQKQSGQRAPKVLEYIKFQSWGQGICVISFGVGILHDIDEMHKTRSLGDR